MSEPGWPWSQTTTTRVVEITRMNVPSGASGWCSCCLKKATPTGKLDGVRMNTDDPPTSGGVKPFYFLCIVCARKVAREAALPRQPEPGKRAKAKR